MLEQRHLSAPGILFSMSHPGYMRFNIAATLDGVVIAALARMLGR